MLLWGFSYFICLDHLIMTETIGGDLKNSGVGGII